MARHFNGSKSGMMVINCSASDDSLLLPTTDVSSPAAGGAGKEALDIKKLAEVVERFQQAILEQEAQTLADIETCATFEECVGACNFGEAH